MSQVMSSSSSSKSGVPPKPILKMSVLAPSKFGGGSGNSNLDPSGEDGGGEGGGGGAGPFTKTQFPGLKQSKLASLPLVVKSSLHTPSSPAPNTSNVSSSRDEVSSSSNNASSFIPLSSQEPLTKAGSGNGSSSITSSVAPLADDAKDPAMPCATPPTFAAAISVAGNTPSAAEEVFVFGEKIQDRAENFKAKEAAEAAESSESSPLKPKETDSTSSPSLSLSLVATTPASTAEGTTAAGDNATTTVPRKTLTLSESAAEWAETHSQQKRKFEEVKLVTGEEDESNVVQLNAKLHVFEKNSSTWTERGRGVLRLNDDVRQDGVAGGSRMVMRTTGSLRVIMNTPLYAGMSVEKPSDKAIRMAGTDDGQARIFLISAAPKDIQDLYAALMARQQQDEPARKKLAN